MAGSSASTSSWRPVPEGSTPSSRRAARAELADSIGRGEPAIILVRVLNAPRSRADLYHYVVVDGHDPSRGLLRLHFGDGVKRWAEAVRLERAWAPTGHLMLRLRPEPGWEPR